MGVVRMYRCIPISATPNSSTPNLSTVPHFISTRLKPVIIVLVFTNKSVSVTICSI